MRAPANAGPGTTPPAFTADISDRLKTSFLTPMADIAQQIAREVIQGFGAAADGPFCQPVSAQ